MTCINGSGHSVSRTEKALKSVEALRVDDSERRHSIVAAGIYSLDAIAVSVPDILLHRRATAVAVPTVPIAIRIPVAPVRCARNTSAHRGRTSAPSPKPDNRPKRPLLRIFLWRWRKSRSAPRSHPYQGVPKSLTYTLQCLGDQGRSRG